MTNEKLNIKLYEKMSKEFRGIGGETALDNLNKG